MKCKKHPKYMGIHKPRVNCDICSQIYEEAKKLRKKKCSHEDYDDGDKCPYCGERITTSYSRHQASEYHGREKWEREWGDYDSW